jgi:hypothetical protein
MCRIITATMKWAKKYECEKYGRNQDSMEDMKTKSSLFKILKYVCDVDRVPGNGHST